MAWRVIGISNPAHLSLKDNKLVVKQEESVSVPIEDIDALLLDSYGLAITANLITKLSDSGTTVIICDEKHLPSSVILPYSQHSRQARVSREQLAMSATLKKQLWSRIIVQKITNQSSVMAKYGHSNKVLIKLSKEVKSGDTTNRESQAARAYFSALLDDETRRKPMWYNSALNYAYAMVRSHLARHIASRGLIVSQGIFHHSELNSYNLADDLIEAYRPMVDDYVFSKVAHLHTDKKDADLTKSDRELLVDVLNTTVIIQGKKFTLKDATERTVESFVQAISSDTSAAILLPSLLK